MVGDCGNCLSPSSTLSGRVVRGKIVSGRGFFKPIMMRSSQFCNVHHHPWLQNPGRIFTIIFAQILY